MHQRKERGSKNARFEGLRKPRGKVFKILECFMSQTLWEESETPEAIKGTDLPLREAESGGPVGCSPAPLTSEGTLDLCPGLGRFPQRPSAAPAPGQSSEPNSSASLGSPRRQRASSSPQGLVQKLGVRLIPTPPPSCKHHACPFPFQIVLFSQSHGHQPRLGCFLPLRHVPRGHGEGPLHSGRFLPRAPAAPTTLGRKSQLPTAAAVALAVSPHLPALVASFPLPLRDLIYLFDYSVDICSVSGTGL